MCSLNPRARRQFVTLARMLKKWSHGIQITLLGNLERREVEARETMSVIGT